MAPTPVAIRAEGLWKTYGIHPPGAPRRGRAQTVEFHALRDVAFEVPEGAVLGIVGPNGAGKSTLLKILSRITDPSRGQVRVAGRVASLLEVGTGFHPELTGLENVYLNAAIHGLKRREVTARLASILAYAEVGDFLHEPVKRYSSGMYLRLAFSIAAHLDPDILIVDELLAVGDARFRERCLGTLREVADRGQTVVLVSHDAATIRSLCTHALHLERGSVVAMGPAAGVVEGYLGSVAQQAGRVEADAQVVRFEAGEAACADDAQGGCRVRWAFALHALRALPGLYVELALEGPSGVRVLQHLPRARGEPPLALASGERASHALKCHLPRLAPGAYHGALCVRGGDGAELLRLCAIPLFHVAPAPDRPECLAPGFGAVLLPPFTLEVQRAPRPL